MNQPTFDENGHLATVVADAKKLIELTDELVALRAQLAASQRREALLRAVAEAAREYISAKGDMERWIPYHKYKETLQAAIDGGAMEGGVMDE